MDSNKIVEIASKDAYLQQAAEEMMWEPVCPICLSTTDAIEPDYSGKQWCESCESTFVVEGL